MTDTGLAPGDLEWTWSTRPLEGHNKPPWWIYHLVNVSYRVTSVICKTPTNHLIEDPPKPNKFPVWNFELSTTLALTLKTVTTPPPYKKHTNRYSKIIHASNLIFLNSVALLPTLTLFMWTGTHGLNGRFHFLLLKLLICLAPRTRLSYSFCVTEKSRSSANSHLLWVSRPECPKGAKYKVKQVWRASREKLWSL